MVLFRSNRVGVLPMFHAAPAFVLLTFLLVTATSCSRRGNVYSPHALPADLVAKPVENSQTLDLSKLATYTTSNQLIDVGDVLGVAVAAGSGTEKVDLVPVRVGDDGLVNVPIIGRVSLAGLELSAAEQIVSAAAVERGYYRNPTVTVTMMHQRVNRITVVGAVEKPGVYELPRAASTLLAAIVAADGLSEQAGTEVEIRRPIKHTSNATYGQPPGSGPAAQQASFTSGPALPGAEPTPAVGQPMSFRLDLAEATKKGEGGGPLEDGDVVMIERRDPKPVHVIGLVMKPGQYELPFNQDLRVLDMIAMAGGVTLNVADKIHVIRHTQGKEQPAVIEISLAEAKSTGRGNLVLAAGDIVSVEETPTTVFMDTIRTFFRVGFTQAIPGI
jgi:polysaccharide export outer membrane protein